MCGIYGEMYYAADGRANHPAGGAMERALELIHHRGPDERGEWRHNGVALGMCRLSIIDLEGGQQPIWNEDNSLCIVFNGELYNFQDLRDELIGKGHIFRTRSDTEVVLHAYEEWGTECLSRFNGMFAFAIWEKPTKTLFIARDRIGEKPLYYYQDGRRLIFASEIKSIVQDRTVPREISPEGLSNYLGFGHSVAPYTIFKNILKLLPGHYLVVRDGSVQEREYWDVGSEPQDFGSGPFSEQDFEQQILGLLSDSVRRRMVADVPVGAFLSGGVDSSAVVALMREHASGPIKTFSLGFDVGGAYNELSEARQVAQYLGTDHYELQVSHDKLVENLQALVFHFDEPFADPAAFPVYLLSKFAREQVKVVLTGDGGDELFGGYRRYAVDRIAKSYQLLPRIFTEGIAPRLVEALPRFRRIKRTIHTLPIRDPARRYARWLETFTPEMRRLLLQERIFQESAGFDPVQVYPQYYNRERKLAADDHINRLLYVDLKTWLVDGYLEKADKPTMAASLEGRIPILDHRLVELAFQIPSQYKIKGWNLKHILKQSVRGIIPDEVLTRPKHGFAVPIDPWFRGDLSEFTYEVLLDERARKRGYFRPEYVEQLWKEHRDGRHVWDQHLWQLLNFELWQRMFIDGEAL